jgi:structural maintenance of chromosome 1
MDAISFVLGIRSSHLRSAQLRDLVYRGRVMKTSKIQDDGTAAPHEEDEGDGSSQRTRGDPKSAWVMAVYEDDAGDQKKWKRTITSSGASEFRINDRVVTAAQYNEALEAENILIKARNFLVFQGDVEAIASQSPQDLTRLIEQISGSLEYKAEYEKLKAEAEQAAENQNFQLHKRRGINSEIKQYQDQKKEADNYQKKTEERDEAVATHILWKLYHFQRVMDETYEQIKGHQENLKEFYRNKKTLEIRLETARKEQATVGREVSKIEKSIRAKEKSIEDRENSLVPINEKIAQSNHNLEMINKKIETVSKQRDVQAASIEKAKKDLATVEKAQQHFEKQWAETLKKQGRELSDADRKEYNRLRAQAMAQSSENKVKLDNLLRQLKSDEVTVNSLKGKVDSYHAAMEKLQAEIDFIKAKMGTTEEVVRDITAELEGKKKQFNKVQSERIRVNNLRTELEEKYQEVLKKLAEADDGRRQNDKEARTKQMVNDLKRLYPGVRGRVGELCKPKQKKYEEAVIVAIGRDFDSVIVDTERAAIDCVQFLKEQRFPPLTFIPLDNIKVNTVNSAVKGIPGVRLTIDTIDFDNSLERAMSYACGSSIVCDSLETAKNVCFQRNIQVKAVTLEGYVIHKGGLMTGGKTPESKGNKRKFEEHDVQNLRKMEENIRGELEKLPRDRRGAAEETLQNDLAGLEHRLRLARSELEAFEKNLHSKQKEIDNQRRGLEEYEPKLEDKEGHLERTRATVAKFEAAISEVEDRIFAEFCQRLGYEDIRAYEAQQGSLEEEAAQKRQDFEVQKSKLQNNLKWEEARYQNEKDRVTQMERSLQNAQSDIEAFAAQKSEIEEAMGEDRDELEALNERFEEIREQHAEKAKRVSEIKQELQKKNKEIEARQKAIDAGVTGIQRNSSLKFALLRRCKLEQIQIPLAEGSLEDVPGEDALLQEQDEDAMDVDGDEDNEEKALEAAMDNHGIEVDFDSLDEDLKNVSDLVPACALV